LLEVRITFGNHAEGDQGGEECGTKRSIAGSLFRSGVLSWMQLFKWSIG